MTENDKMLALEVLDRFDEHTSALLLLLQHYRDSLVPYFCGAGGPKTFTGLHGVACLGIWGVVSTVLDMKEGEVNGSGCMGMMALTRASIKGH